MKCAAGSRMEKSFFRSTDVQVFGLPATPIFKNATQMGFCDDMAQEWEHFRDLLRRAGFCYARGGDYITWNGPMKHNLIVVKEAYRFIISHTHQINATKVFYPYWHRNIPTKITMFGWLIWRNKVLTWENLMKRGYMGPSICALCRVDVESTTHLFFTCSVTTSLWRLFSDHLMDPAWRPSDFMTVAREWDLLNSKYRSLPFYLTWEIWLARNRIIFEGRPFHLQQSYTVIMKWMVDPPLPTSYQIDCSVRIRPHPISIPAIYFDGASDEGMTGCGVWIKVSGTERYNIYWNGGPGTNNKAEIMALWGGLLFAYDMQLQGVCIYGDSQLIINWVTNSFHMMTPHLRGWIDRTQSLWNKLGCPEINHIYREGNTRADKLSKKGLEADFGYMMVSHYLDGRQIEAYSIPIP